jgi:hypothetical protein
MRVSALSASGGFLPMMAAEAGGLGYVGGSVVAA